MLAHGQHCTYHKRDSHKIIGVSLLLEIGEASNLSIHILIQIFDMQYALLLCMHRLKWPTGRPANRYVHTHHFYLNFDLKLFVILLVIYLLFGTGCCRCRCCCRCFDCGWLFFLFFFSSHICFFFVGFVFLYIHCFALVKNLKSIKLFMNIHIPS